MPKSKTASSIDESNGEAMEIIALIFSKPYLSAAKGPPFALSDSIHRAIIINNAVPVFLRLFFIYVT